MLFKSEKYSATWDTWMYYYQDTYYLYYLITEKSPGEGFGVATSPDGIFWTDHGLAIQASDEMTFYLGTGSVWKSPDFENDMTFICNYSEWREKNGIKKQNILFAWSHDLINWHKYGDEYMFQIDEKYYESDQNKDARWDCIYPVAKEDGGYYGYWTAKPKNFYGFGFGQSADGIHWEALEAPRILWEDQCFFKHIEAGAVAKINQKYYCMLGNYSEPSGMYTFVAKEPTGPFLPATKNYRLLTNQSFFNTYFARFVETPEALLVNHHSIKRVSNPYGRPVTYLALLKRADVDEEGTLRLAWWHGNEKIKGALISEIEYQSIESNLKNGIIIEGEIEFPGKISLLDNGNQTTEFIARVNGVAEVKKVDISSGSENYLENVDRMMITGSYAQFRFILKDSMVEFYVNDILLICYTLEERSIESIKYYNMHDIKIWNYI